MRSYLAALILTAGVGQLSVLFASALVPIRLEWRDNFSGLSKLHRQLFWVYGGYVVLAIASLGLISIFNAGELAAGSFLARCFCGYVAVFWTIRLALQLVLDAEQHLCTWWLRLGYHLLTVLFSFFAIVYTWAALF